MQKNIIRHLIFSTNFGNAAIIYRENPFKLIKTILPRANKKSLMKIMSTEERGEAGKHQKARLVSRRITEYFEGKPLPIPWKWMDMGSLTELQQSVLVALTRIPYGELRTYKDIAEEIGHPGASRFVGTTLAKNPFPILLPCHRVIRSDGAVGQFGGGTELKMRMIELEAKYVLSMK